MQKILESMKIFPVGRKKDVLVKKVSSLYFMLVSERDLNLSDQ